MSGIEDLEKLAELKAKGIITEEEFEKQKRFYLNNIGEQAPTRRPKGMIEYYKICWKKSFQYSGRASRSEYWFFVLANFLVSFILGFLNGFFTALVPIIGLLFGLASTVYSIAYLFPYFSVYVRRFHDIGKSGWFAFAPTLALLIIVPLIIISSLAAAYNETMDKGPAVIGFVLLGFILLAVGIMWGIVFPCMPSQEGQNKYGHNPFQ